MWFSSSGLKEKAWGQVPRNVRTRAVLLRCQRRVRSNNYRVTSRQEVQHWKSPDFPVYLIAQGIKWLQLFPNFRVQGFISWCLCEHLVMFWRCLGCLLRFSWEASQFSRQGRRRHVKTEADGAMWMFYQQEDRLIYESFSSLLPQGREEPVHHRERGVGCWKDGLCQICHALLRDRRGLCQRDQHRSQSPRVKPNYGGKSWNFPLCCS